MATVAALTTASLLGACSDDGESRLGSFSSDAGPDIVANLPEAALDGDAAGDARVERGPFNPESEPVTCAGAATACAKQIAAGHNHFCARMSDGTVQCWGKDDYGALGRAAPLPTDAASAAAIVEGLTKVTQISAGAATTCARREDGTVSCWGENSQGQLGLNDVEPIFDEERHPIPEAVKLPDSAVRVDVGSRVACAVLGTGKVACWGNNETAQLARPDAPPESALGPALAVLEPVAITRASLGTATVLGLTIGGELVSWGEVSGRDGLLGGRMTSISPDPTPKSIVGLKKVTSLAATSTRPGAIAHACAIADGEVYCWGRSHVGALCTGVAGAEILPTHSPVSGKAWPQQLAVGDGITCARMTDGSVQCCGEDRGGRLGPDRPEPFSGFFAPIASFKGHAVEIAVSDHAVCVLENDGSVACWGGNAFGELATPLPDDEKHPSPVKVTFQ